MKRLLAFFAFAALAGFCGCRGSQPVAPTLTPPPGQTFVDVLSEQLKTINYPPIVTRDGESMTVRVRVSSTLDVQRAVCRSGGWPFGDRIIRFDETLRGLRQEGVRRIQIVGDKETLLMQINQEGKCESGIAESK